MAKITDVAYNQFKTDLKTLYTDAGIYNNDLQTASDAKAALGNAIKKLVAEAKGNPWTLLMLFISFLSQPADQYNQAQLGKQAGKVKIQADLTQLTNDMQGIVNEKGTTTGLQHYTSALDDMMQILGGGDGLAPQSAWQENVCNAIGGSQSANFLEQGFAKIRSDIGGTDPGVTPESFMQKANYTGPINTNPDFSLNSDSTTQITSFGQMFTELSQTGTGGLPEAAQNGNDLITNTNSELTTAEGSLTAQVTTEIQQIKTQITTDVSAESSFAQDILTADRTAIKNETPQ